MKQLDNFNQKLSLIIDVLKNLKIIIIMGLTVIIMVMAVFFGKGFQIFNNFYTSIVGSPIENYVAVQDRWDTPYLIVQDILDREGLKTDISEYTSFKASETETKLKWSGQGQKVRVYLVKQKADGSWYANEVKR